MQDFKVYGLRSLAHKEHITWSAAKACKDLCHYQGFFSVFVKLSVVYLLSFVVPVVVNNRYRSHEVTYRSAAYRSGFSHVSYSLCEYWFFHDEIESPERVTVSVIILSESLLTSRIIAHSVKNSIEFLSQQWGFYGFC